ncbi:unnamed protein product [Owenia fusiformis]|uniref:Uncharacterized protein n=1 Tax=Owenia fusiformis TaxID=6347 RepID=A0A8J1U5G3_OWEFU|nr:unnamed protein product [Owenia fusiformis]
MDSTDISDTIYQKRSLGNKLYKWKKTGTFCDLIIKTQYNVTLLVHKVIICASSEFLKAMVVAQGSRLPTLNLSRFNIGKDIMELLVDFMYDQPIQPSWDNIEAVTSAARAIGLDELLEIFRENEQCANIKGDVNDDGTEYSDIKQESMESGNLGDDNCWETEDVRKTGTADDVNFSRDEYDPLSDIDSDNLNDDYDELKDDIDQQNDDKNKSQQNNANKQLIYCNQLKNDDGPKLSDENDQLNHEGNLNNGAVGQPYVTSSYDKEWKNSNEENHSVHSGFNLKECSILVKRIKSETLKTISQKNSYGQLCPNGFSFYDKTAEDDFYTCKKCTKTFVYINALRDHVGLNHLNQKSKTQCNLLCKTCDESIMVKDWKLHHSTKHNHEDAEYTCTQCNAIYIHDLDLLCHIAEHAGNVDICTICDKTFSTEQEVTSHWMMYHTHCDIMFCHICGRVCPTKKILQEHIINDHAIQYIEVILKLQDPITGEDMQTNDSKCGAHKCQKCAKVFPRPNKLESHYMNTHTNLKPFTCDLCKAQFGTQSLLNVHKKRLHTVEGRFMCDRCGNEYLNLLQLKSHIQRHKFRNRKNRIRKRSRLKNSDTQPYIKPEMSHLTSGENPQKYIKAKVNLQDPITNEDMFTTDSKPGMHKCRKCAKVFPRPIKLEAHYMNTHTNLRPFPCDLCEFKYSTQSLLNTHKKRWHTIEQGNFTCDQCGKEYPNLFRLKSHMLIHKYKHIKRVRKDRPPKPATCQICHQNFQSRALMSAHRVKIHSVKPFACKECPKRFYKASVLDRHIGNNHTTCTPYSCAICDFKFPTKSSLSGHIKLHAKGKQMPKEQRVLKSQANLPIQCELCGEVCLGKEYKTHKTTKHGTPSWPPLGEGSVDGKIYKCFNCEQMFEEFKLYKKHFVVSHSNVASHQCAKCNESFLTKTSLANHMKECHSDRTFNCTECERKFETAKSLKDHQLIHCICNVCNKQLSSRKTLYRHKRHLHGDDKPYQCNQCKQRFIIPSELNVHIQHKHIGKIYCSICDKHFPNLNLLRKHRVLTHKTGKLDTSPTPCDVCGKSLKGTSGLRVHMQNVHGASSKSVQCHICGKEFHSRKYCSAHIRRVHTEKDVADITCVHCGSTFSAKSSMLRHVSLQHPNVSPPLPLQCKHCSEIFREEKHLENHILVSH